MTVTTAEIAAILAKHGYQRERLVQMLWDVQDKYSYIPAEAIDALASALQIPRAHVEGSAGFYSFFYDRPRGRFNVLFSHNITDIMLGKDMLMQNFMAKLGVTPGVPRADGMVTVDNTSCTGMCEQGPALLVNAYTIPRLNAAKLDQIADLINAGTPLSEWPQEWFQVEANIRRKDLLLDHHGSGSEELYTLKALIGRGAEEILAELDEAGLRGCGGAGFKTATKWRLCRETQSDERFVVCNADEGEPGTFKDRVLLQFYPDLVFEGMTLCAGVIGAKKGFLYLRGEYRYMLGMLEETLQHRRAKGLLGENILGHAGFDFDIEIHLGAGAYVCGAELALVESLEGKRGTPRNRPPFPVTHGYQHKPTVVNNVETFAIAAKIPYYGAHKFTSVGTAQSKGTKLISVSGDCATPGIYEIPFGTSIRELLSLCGGGDAQAVQVSGAAGQFLSAAEFDRTICFEDVACGGSFMVFGKNRDLLDMVRNFATFFVHESCGFCTPCRVGTSVQRHLLEKIATGHGTYSDLEEIEKLGVLMQQTSHCGLGATASNHLLDTLKKAPHIYQRHLKADVSFAPSFDLDAALSEARQLTARDDEQAHL
jgi:[NiFe] hydrogenase diaphorase moiety large subunit